MPAYILVDVKISDPKKYEEYKRLVPPTIEAYGGRFVVRGGEAATLEGDWAPERIVILEFASVERAKAWWGSPEYAGPKAMRQSASQARMIVVEGMS